MTLGDFMSAVLARKANWISPEEYLAIERAADVKNEYFDGEMFGWNGASRQHSSIKVSLTAVVGNQLRGKPCEPFGSDTRVKIPTKNFFYPDLTIACEPEWMDKEFDTLTNPLVIFEILSPSNEAWDRGGKFREYRSIPSLQEYVLISQDRPLVEIFSRRENDFWLLRDVEGRDAKIALESVPEVTLSLAEIYERITFEDEAPTDESNSQFPITNP
jgi:Uma2 family endonuclease